MQTINRTMTAPAQNLKGVALQPDPDFIAGPYDTLGVPGYNAPAGRRIASVWLENTKVEPLTVTVTATPSNQSFTVPPRSSANYDVSTDRTGTALSVPAGVRYVVHLAPL